MIVVQCTTIAYLRRRRYSWLKSDSRLIPVDCAFGSRLILTEPLRVGRCVQRTRIRSRALRTEVHSQIDRHRKHIFDLQMDKAILCRNQVDRVYLAIIEDTAGCGAEVNMGPHRHRWYPRPYTRYVVDSTKRHRRKIGGLCGERAGLEAANGNRRGCLRNIVPNECFSLPRPIYCASCYVGDSSAVTRCVQQN